MEGRRESSLRGTLRGNQSGGPGLASGRDSCGQMPDVLPFGIISSRFQRSNGNLA